MTGLDGLLARARAAHEVLMVDTLRLVRPGAPVFDRDTGAEVPGPVTTLYEGPGRVRAMTQATGQQVQAGEREVVLRGYEVALPWSAPVLGGGRVVPGDVVAVDGSPDARLVGLQLWVTSVQYGATATAWRLSAEDRS